MGANDTFKRGQHNVLCDRCGFKYTSGNLRKEWTGLMTCHGPHTNNCYETRHPQENVKGRVDRQSPPWTRPESPDTFLSPGDVTPEDL